MSLDGIFNNLQTTYVSNVPVFSLSNVGSRSVPMEGSLMYNIDDTFLYVSKGPAIGWSPVGQGSGTAIHVVNTTQSTSCNTGSITTLGGVGVVGNVNICGTLAVAGGTTLSGQVAVTNSTPSTDPATGALVVLGGVGIGGDLYVGGMLTATQLATTGADVIVNGSAPPTNGQVLTAVSATAAVWQDVDTSSITGVLPVSNGGTGDSTLTLNGVLVGNGTSPITTNKQAPAGAFVGTNDTQALTNKTITNPNNTITATQLATTGSDVIITGYASAPSGLVLTATSATTADWQTPATQGPATELATSNPGYPVQVNVSAPTAGAILVGGSADAIWTTISGTYPINASTFSNSMGSGGLVAGAPLFAPTWLYNRIGDFIIVTGGINLSETNPSGASGDSIDILLPVPVVLGFTSALQAYGYIYPNYLYLANEFGGYVGAIVGSTTKVRLYVFTQYYPLNGVFTINFMYRLGL